MLRALPLAAAAAAAVLASGSGVGAPAGAGPVPFHYDLYTFRGSSAGATTVVAAFAVPAGNLEREEGDREVRYRFDVTLVLSDTVLKTVSRTDDSVYVALRRPPGGEHLLHTHIEVQAPPSGTTLQRVILSDATTPGMGQLYSASFPIPDYGGGDLMLSDIALGLPGAGGGWRRGQVTLALLPTSQFPQGSFDVYYEVYNLPSGNRYATELTVEQLADPQGSPPGDALPVQARFTGEAHTEDDGSLRELRRVDAALARGSHRLTVTVTDLETGARTSRSRPFQVRGWGPGATLVQALPRTSPTGPGEVRY